MPKKYIKRTFKHMYTPKNLEERKILFNNCRVDIQIICEQNNFNYDKIMTKSRKRPYVTDRKRIIKELYDLGYSSTQIGFAIKRDASTVNHTLRQMRAVNKSS